MTNEEAAAELRAAAAQIDDHHAKPTQRIRRRREAFLMGADKLTPDQPTQPRR